MRPLLHSSLLMVIGIAWHHAVYAQTNERIITADMLRHLSHESYHRHKHNRAPVYPGKIAAFMHEMLPSEISATNTKNLPPPPSSTKITSTEDEKPPQMIVVTPLPPHPSSTHIYFPPQRVVTKSHSDDIHQPKKKSFGIDIGKWIKGKIKRQLTNADPGLIEIIVTEAVKGRVRTVPAGSILFAQKYYNQGTLKLDLIVQRGLLPDGEEFPIKGLIYNTQFHAGLVGQVIKNKDFNKNKLSKALIQSGKKILQTHIGTQSTAPLVSVAGDAAFSPLAPTMNAKLPYIISVAPQQVNIQVQKSF